MKPDTLATAAAKDGELHHFDAELTFEEASVDEGIYIKISEENQTLLGAVGLLNKTYRLLLAERCWFNKFRVGRTVIVLEQSEANPCVVFRKFDDGRVEMVVVMQVDDILAHAKDQATMERFTAELGRKFQVKSMVETFGVEKTTRTTASSGVSTLSKADEPQTPKEK